MLAFDGRNLTCSIHQRFFQVQQHRLKSITIPTSGKVGVESHHGFPTEFVDGPKSVFGELIHVRVFLYTEQ